MVRLAPALALALLLAGANPLSGQAISRPWDDWRTLETDHFLVHYPADLAAWTEPMAARLESVHEAVTSFVEYEPDETITVIVEDPRNVSNGSAWPGGVVILWPTPPDPESNLERHRGWGEILSVHELAHVAHIERPTRNPAQRFLVRFLPFPVRPIQTAPRWALEGYATLIEGRLTGSGRPHGAWRPTILRRWALEGRLPTYGRLSETEGFFAGEMAYLAGSAYLEWLVERSGDESLPHVWRRLTARRTRSFDEAFAGVFGGSPAELYGLFTVDVTEKALAAEERLEAAGLAEGELVQRLEGWSFDPAVSPDGTRIAVVRQPRRDEPSEIVIWPTVADTLTTAEREAEARALARDPEDVPDVEWRPRPRRAQATLEPVGGRGHGEPRWLPDGERLLVVRFESAGDGALLPDLFEWTWRDGGVRRVTHGEGIREADPESGGHTAVGHRCLNGACDLVRIDLASGAVTVLAAGDPHGLAYAGARAAPDGRIVASVRRDERWALELLDAAGTTIRRVDPDDGAVRAGPAFLPGGGAIVAVSDRSGVMELETIDLASGEARQITRTTGASLAPAPSTAGGIFFLSLTTHGYDLRRIGPDVFARGTAVLGAELAPAAPVPPVETAPFPAAPVPPSRPYGIGPRGRTVLPLGHWAPEGWTAGLLAHGSDPVGRLGWNVGALMGAGSAWRGGQVSVLTRRWRPELRGDGFWARHRPSEQSLDGIAAPAGLDFEMAGGALGLALDRDYASRRWEVRLGGSAARLDRRGLGSDPRTLAWAEGSASWLQTRGAWRFTEAFGLHGAAGETADESWRRGIVSASLSAGRNGSGLRARGLYGATDQGPGGFEAFVVGGVRPPLLPSPVLSQRIEEPAVPVGYASGSKAASVTLEWVAGDVSTFYRWVSAGGSIGDWKRVTGIELRVDEEALPFLGLPAFQATLGFARSLDEPFEDDNRFTFALRYDP